MPQSLRAPRPSTALSVSRAPARTSPRKRGYTYRWDQLSRKIRQNRPFCERCEQAGRMRLAEVVDHKIPVAGGGALLDEANVWPLCQLCHDAWKRPLERYATETGQIDQLIVWCDDPSKRPRQFR